MVLEVLVYVIPFMREKFSWAGWLLAVPLVAAIHCNKSDSENVEPPDAVELTDTVIATGLSHPWEILWGPDDHIWMTERNGRVSRLNPENGQLSPLLTISEVVDRGEGGLLGMALHPQFPLQPYVYLVYNYENANGDYREKLVRYSYSSGSGTLSSPAPLLEDLAAANIHNGSRLLIVGDKLFMTTGDAATTSLPQNINSLSGKILRLNLDGTIPSDNPVAGNPYWSFGHRNPQGLVFANNKLYSSEHGPSNDDEINIIEKGSNYGWPNVQGFCDDSGEDNFCSANNVKEPIKAWTPTIATCGLDYYNHDLIPQWKNSLLLATLKNQRVFQLKLSTNGDTVEQTNEYFSGSYGRLRDICVSPDGRVFLASSNGNNDKIVMIEPK